LPFELTDIGFYTLTRATVATAATVSACEDASAKIGGLFLRVIGGFSAALYRLH
jgi:hypothetical protein